MSQPEHPKDPMIGKRIGDCVVTGALGQGGMGVVYKAKNLKLQRPVALKLLLRKDLGPAEEDVQRFLREARTAAAFNHPNIVTVHSVGKQGKHCFIEMEFVDGYSLEALVAKKGALPLEKATELAVTCCDALEVVHAKGVVHRDIKPANVMVTRDGHVKLMDFGLAKGYRVDPHLTSPGAVAGTPLYMSPEQCSGETLDARSDVYAMGAMYFYLLTGRPPFVADDALIIMLMHKTDPPPDPRALRPELPVGVTAIIEKAMAKAPDGRYQSCGELREAILSLTKGVTPAPGSPAASAVAEGACPHCGHAVSRYATRCIYCGYLLGRRCPACKEAVRDGAVKCPHCGAAIDGSGSKAPTPNLEPTGTGGARGPAPRLVNLASVGQIAVALVVVALIWLGVRANDRVAASRAASFQTQARACVEAAKQGAFADAFQKCSTLVDQAKEAQVAQDVVRTIQDSLRSIQQQWRKSLRKAAAEAGYKVGKDVALKVLRVTPGFCRGTRCTEVWVSLRNMTPEDRVMSTTDLVVALAGGRQVKPQKSVLPHHLSQVRVRPGGAAAGALVVAGGLAECRDVIYRKSLAAPVPQY